MDKVNNKSSVVQFADFSTPHVAKRAVESAVLAINREPYAIQRSDVMAIRFYIETK